VSIKGNVQTTKTNDWGFTSYKVSSTWYGADSKGPARASEGEWIEFEAFDKPGKEGKVYPTIKLATLKKISAANIPSGSGNTNDGHGSGSAGRVANESGGSRQDYWAAKGIEDAKRDPRISYFASLERAIQFVDLALRNGAIGAYEKAKATGKLEVLTALVYETTQRIMAEAYSQEVPTPGNKRTTSTQVVTDLPAQAELESDPEESWS